MASKTRIEFEGFEEVVSKLLKLEGDIKSTTEKALKASHSKVTPQIQAAMSRHRRSGDTEKSIVTTPRVSWNGGSASVDVGFDISSGGLPSIFLMYGTPRMKKDSVLYNSIYGKRVRDEVRRIQEDIFWKEIRRLDR